MSLQNVIHLVKTLSKSEKRSFKLLANRTTGDKDYINLFELIDRSSDISIKDISERYVKQYPKTSLDNTSRYLLNFIVDNLTAGKTKEDLFNGILYGLIRVNILIDRNLTGLAVKELKRLECMAIESQNHLMAFLCIKYQLNLLLKDNLRNIAEKELIELQMKARDNLKTCMNVHEHSVLYELLRHRITNIGRTISREERLKLNDLVLSEMAIVNARIKDNFDSKKLHLLFQSFFFSDIGDYTSAYRTFYDLNNLMEKNIALQSPPLDYLSSLDGILDSLRTTKSFDKMPFYIQRLKALDTPVQSENFRHLIKKTILIYELVLLLGEDNLQMALQVTENQNIKEIYAFRFADEEKQNELFFYIALTYFLNKKYKKAGKYINEVVFISRSASHSLIYRASTLLSILIRYESDYRADMDYAIRSFKRIFSKEGQLFKAEKILFKVIVHNPKISSKQRNKILWAKIESTLIEVNKDKFEKQLLKYFDFTTWVSHYFTHIAPRIA